MNLSGKVAIVTGASRGIGRSIAMCLAEAGAKVVINYRSNAELAEQVKAEIEAKGGQAHAIQGCVTDPEAMKAMVKETVQVFGGLDILVNNAGILLPKFLMMTKPEEWAKTIDTNLTGVYNAIKPALRPMIEKKQGRIINITSVAGLSGIPGQAAYGTTKAGLIGLTNVLAKELAGFGITVNAIAPGFIETDMTSVFDEKTTEQYINSIPLKKYGRPEDIGHMAVYLASDLAGYITGQTIAVDGGLSS
jgi:3-oxoacyl-[acyl-carrier protein] reductase